MKALTTVLGFVLRESRISSPFPPAEEARKLAQSVDPKEVARNILAQWVLSTTAEIGEKAQNGARSAFVWLPGERGHHENPAVTRLIREGSMAALRSAGYRVDHDGHGRLNISW